MTYRERLWPAPWVWVASMLIAATGGLVTIKVASAQLSVIIAVLCVLATVYGLMRTSSTVAVHPAGPDAELLAGRAHIPLRHVGVVEVLDPQDFRTVRGPRADARAYLCQRGWIEAGVRAWVDDPADPTPYWLISSRRPQRLAAAIEAARGAQRPEGSGRPEGSDRPDGSGQAHSRQTG